MKKFISLIALVATLGVSGMGTSFADDMVESADEMVTAVAETAAVAVAEATEMAEAAAPVAEAEAEPEIVVDKGDVSWMMVATLLVVMMTVPGVALFYGGLVRSKNMLSVLMQVLVVFSLISVLWAIYGYSLAFGSGEGLIIGDLGKLFLKGVTADSLADTFTDNVKIPELIFIAFQCTFAGITTALIVGSFAERIKFSAVILFSVIWFTISYIPIAHMVWGVGGYILDAGAFDFAGGTVVHINAAVAGLVGAYMVGHRIGYGKEAMPPHNLPLTMVGASLLWVGWFGFNAGSNLEATGGAGLAFANTLFATAAAVVAWTLGEVMTKGKASMLGAATGAVAGLVAITPACGSVGPMGSIIVGLAGGFICLWGCTGLKKLLRADDTLDVFGVHGIGGIVGALLTGVFTDASLGGIGMDTTIAEQVMIQAEGVVITIVWSAVAAVIAFKIADIVIGLRVAEDTEREGLDTTHHGERAYTL